MGCLPAGMVGFTYTGTSIVLVGVGCSLEGSAVGLGVSPATDVVSGVVPVENCSMAVSAACSVGRVGGSWVGVVDVGSWTASGLVGRLSTSARGVVSVGLSHRK